MLSFVPFRIFQLMLLASLFVISAGCVSTSKPGSKVSPFMESVAHDYFLEGLKYGEQKKFELARGSLRRSIDYNPNDARPYHFISISYISERNFSEAIRYGLLALNVNPDYCDAIGAVALAHFAQEQYTDAIPYYQRLQKCALVKNRDFVQVNNVSPLHSLGICYAATGDLFASKSSFEEYLKKAKSVNEPSQSISEAQNLLQLVVREINSNSHYVKSNMSGNSKKLNETSSSSTKKANIYQPPSHSSSRTAPSSPLHDALRKATEASHMGVIY